MKKMPNHNEEIIMNKTHKNNKGQGMTEYIVILGLIVACAVGVFWTQISGAINGKVSKIAGSLS